MTKLDLNKSPASSKIENLATLNPAPPRTAGPRWRHPTGYARASLGRSLQLSKTSSSSSMIKDLLQEEASSVSCLAPSVSLACGKGGTFVTFS